MNNNMKNAEMCFMIPLVKINFTNTGINLTFACDNGSIKAQEVYRYDLPIQF